MPRYWLAIENEPVEADSYSELLDVLRYRTGSESVDLLDYVFEVADKVERVTGRRLALDDLEYEEDEETIAQRLFEELEQADLATQEAE